MTASTRAAQVCVKPYDPFYIKSMCVIWAVVSVPEIRDEGNLIYFYKAVNMVNVKHLFTFKQRHNYSRYWPYTFFVLNIFKMINVFCFFLIWNERKMVSDFWTQLYVTVYRTSPEGMWFWKCPSSGPPRLSGCNLQASCLSRLPSTA